MRYNKVMYANKSELEKLEKMFSLTEDEMGDIPRLQNLKTFTIPFDNRCQMDIKVNSSEDDIWSEAVLFDELGRQLAFTEPSYTIMGEWEIEYDGDIYVAELKVA